jgi:glycosyltransferase involved in cell wall biosynthesis
VIKHIGIIGPIHLPSLNIKYNGDRSLWPKGMGGTPVNAEINALLELGYRVTVFSLSPEIKKNDYFEYSDNSISIYIGEYRSKARQRCSDLFKKEINLLTNRIKLLKPDILHAHWQYEWALAGINSGISCLITCHDEPKKIFLQYKDIYRLCRWILANKVYKYGKFFTTVSPATAKHLILNQKKEISIIPNFVEEKYYNLNKIRQIENKVRIVMINNGFSNAKNVKKGILAFKKLNNTNFELHLYGKEHGINEKAHIFCKKIGLNSNVYFHGFISPDKLIHQIDENHILLHPSKIESFGMVLIESMAMGIPVIAGKNSGGVEWILKNGGGKLIDINNCSEIASAIVEVIENYETLSKEAFLNVKNRFSKKNVINQYLNEFIKISKINESN